MESKVLTILFTDMKGFTENSGSRTRQEVLDLVRRHDDLLRPIIVRFGGRVVKTIGDAFLAGFESPTNAVLCGLLMQATLREHNADAAAGQRIEVRVAINAGEVQITPDDVFGEPVNVAARINAITEPGEVYFTHSVYLAMNKTEVPSSEVGERILKGVAEPIRVYRLIQDAASDQYRRVLESIRGQAYEPAAEEKRANIGLRPRSRALPLAIGAVVLVAASSALTWWTVTRTDWEQEARDAAKAGGWTQAWERIDRRFAERPADPRVPVLAREIAQAQIDALAAAKDHERALTLLDGWRKDRNFVPGLEEMAGRVARAHVDALAAADEHERALAFLEALRKERSFVPGIEEMVEATTQAHVARLIKLGDERHDQALELLWARHQQKPEDARRLLEYAVVYERHPRRWESKVVQHFHEVLRLDPTLAADTRIRDPLVRFAKENLLPPSHSEGVLLWDILARHYAAEVKGHFRPLVTGDDPAVRLHAYGICSRIEPIPPAEEFEYQRLNLFQCVDFLSDFHEKAVEYFAKNWFGKAEAVKPFTQGQEYASIPVLEKYASTDVENAIPIIGSLFYEPARRFLLEHVHEKDNVTLRYSCQRLLQEKGEMTPELRHRYHLMNLEEYDTGQFRYWYPWVDETLAYLQSGEVEGDAWRAEAVAAIEKKRKEIADALADEHVQKSEKLMQKLQEGLEQALAKLAGGGK